MAKVRITPELEAFLRKERVLTRFKKSVINDVDFKEIGKHHVYRNISTSFHWRLAPEGIKFWGDLETKFENQK